MTRDELLRLKADASQMAFVVKAPRPYMILRLIALALAALDAEEALALGVRSIATFVNHPALEKRMMSALARIRAAKDGA